MNRFGVGRDGKSSAIFTTCSYPQEPQPLNTRVACGCNGSVAVSQLFEIQKIDFETCKIRLEIADVQIYLLRIADVLDIDLPKAVFEKMKINEARF